jgi:hypothetical protein
MKRILFLFLIIILIGSCNGTKVLLNSTGIPNPSFEKVKIESPVSVSSAKALLIKPASINIYIFNVK